MQTMFDLELQVDGDRDGGVQLFAPAGRGQQNWMEPFGDASCCFKSKATFSPFDWPIDWQTKEEQAPLTPALWV